MTTLQNTPDGASLLAKQVRSIVGDRLDALVLKAPLAEVDWETVYVSGPHGYSDYPTYEPSQMTSEADQQSKGE